MEATPDDAALVEEARRGNASALEALLRMHQTVAYRTAYAITRSPEDAEDVVQSAFLKAARSLHRFRAGSPFRPWLLTIVGNEARNLRRTVLRRLRLVERAAREAPTPAQSAGSSAVADEERRRLLAAVDGLPPDDRLAIVGRYFVGLTLEETAAACGRVHWGHGGATPGFATYVLATRDGSTVVVAAANEGDRHAVHHELFAAAQRLFCRLTGRARIAMDTGAPCVLAWERASHPGNERYSAKPS